MADATPTLDLKSRELAGLLAWAIPGMGHLYQGRTAKGVAFFLVILSLFVYGSRFGHGRVVYLRWDKGEQRWSYPMQLGVGLAAVPALLDHFGWRPNFAAAIPFLASYQAKPLEQNELETLADRLQVDRPADMTPDAGGAALADKLRGAGHGYVVAMAEVCELHRVFGVRMDVALVYTMIAGLLNILAIYDAVAGPAYWREDEDEKLQRQADRKATATA
jgi:hypothetical protein